MTGWSAGAGGVLTNAEAHSGAYSYAALDRYFVSQSFAAILVSDIFELSFWVKRIGGPFNSFRFTYSDGSSDSTLFVALGLSDDWMYFDVKPDLDASKSLVGIQVFGTSPGPAYLDDLRLVPVAAVPEMETFAMLLAGLALIGAVVTRRKVNQI